MSAFLFMALGVAQAQPSSASSISFQGALTGTNGQPLPNGNYNLAFRFYDAPAPGGNAVSTNILVANVTVTSGVASTAIPVDPAWFNGQTRYLGIAINGAAELTPRTLITAVPYAAFAQMTRGVTTDGSGRVGLGTTNLYGTLKVVGDSSQPALVVGHSNPSVAPLQLIPLGWDQPSGALQWGLFTPFAHQCGAGCGPDALIYWNGQTLSLGSPDGGRPVFNVGIGTRTPQAELDVAGTTRTRVLQITGGADLAEHLSVTAAQPNAEFKVEPGMVVSIDPTGNRKFKLADEAYDRKRVGIISGGNGVQPGLVLRDAGNPQADGEQPIALTGQVWCHADATFGPITPGDLLTTSTTPGHAMSVSDDVKARFAVLGQALTGLKEGRGWVQVLVGKQ